MLMFKDISIGDKLYMIETGPIVIELLVLDKLFKDGEDRLKIRGSDLIFEVDFKDIVANSFKNKDEAGANAIKHIFDAINDLVQTLTENKLNDYYDVEKELEKYKDMFPEVFI